MPRRLLVTLGTVALSGCLATSAASNTSHAGWPPIDGLLLINKLDQARPLDGRPGHDPFDGTAPSTPCGGRSRATGCVPGGIPVVATSAAGIPCPKLLGVGLKLGLPTDPVCAAAPSSEALVPATIGHNELLGGHGNDVIHAGPAGDVIWGDYKPSDQPATQVDRLFGGPGNDFIYASHGTNYISTGGGSDVVHAHFGRGVIQCDSPAVVVYLSHGSRHHYHVVHCHHISYRTLGY